jgi:hypothetical protein
VADADVALERSEVVLVEDLRDQPEVLDDGHGLTVGRGDSGCLLTAVLEGEQPEVDRGRNLLSWGVDAEDAASFAGAVQV